MKDFNKTRDEIELAVDHHLVKRNHRDIRRAFWSITRTQNPDIERRHTLPWQFSPCKLKRCNGEGYVSPCLGYSDKHEKNDQAFTHDPRCDGQWVADDWNPA